MEKRCSQAIKKKDYFLRVDQCFNTFNKGTSVASDVHDTVCVTNRTKQKVLELSLWSQHEVALIHTCVFCSGIIFPKVIICEHD